MRSHPSGWSSLLAQLGFRRRRVKRAKRNEPSRRPRIEPLEARQMLSITVDTLVDENDGIGVGGISLREAIASAGLYGNQIDFAASLAGGTISLGAQLTISNSVDIIGPGADRLTIAADGAHGVFKVELGATSTISGVTISGGGGVQYGGGVWNSGNLTLNEVIVTNNSSIVGGGRRA